MGRQGYLVIAVVILASALFAATRRDWASMLLSALLLPLIVFALIHVLTRSWMSGTRPLQRKGKSGEGMDTFTFLARTNPLMFLVFGAVSRGMHDEQYQELLRYGPYGLGRRGYILALFILLAPLALALIIPAATGHLPTHSAPHF